jgi:uncharacterized protein YjbI with pentapeptide repeats
MRTDLQKRWFDYAQSSTEVGNLLALLHEKKSQNELLVDFRGIMLGCEDRPSYVPEKNLAKAQISGIDFTGSMFCNTSLAESVFSGTLFADCDMREVVLIRSQFSTCSFQKAKLRVNVQEATFVGCDFTDAKFVGKSMLGPFGGRQAVFMKCDFSRAEFKNLLLRGAKFENCTFDGTTFVKCDLRDGEFIGARPNQAQFEKCEM